MKRRLAKVGLLLIGGLALTVGLVSYRSFHDPRAMISSSPKNPRWAVDFLISGFVDLSLDFRVHDVMARPFGPRYICDLYWENRHWPSELRWSKDGSVVAITEIFKGHSGEYYGCAYDFSSHQFFRTGTFGGPLEPSAEFTSRIDKLLESHGGVGQVAPVPDASKP